MCKKGMSPRGIRAGALPGQICRQSADRAAGIDRYDGPASPLTTVPTKRAGRARTVEVYTFIGRMVQHVFTKGFQRIRYYGVQATKTFARLKGVIQAALAKVNGLIKGTIKIVAP